MHKVGSAAMIADAIGRVGWGRAVHSRSLRRGVASGLTVRRQGPLTSIAVVDQRQGMKAPTGTQVGFRTWSAQGQATFHNTTIN